MAPSIAFFDVDQTLCACFSGYHTVVELVRRGIIKKRRLVEAFLYKTVGPLFRKVNVQRLYEITLVDLAGIKLEDIMQIGYEIFERDVKPKIYVEAIEEVSRLKQEGYDVVLISSGPYMMIKQFEAFFQADASFSVGPVIRDGILQKEVQEPVFYKEGKIKAAQIYADEKNIALKDCLFYSDSYSDIPLLELVGQARAVNPDKHLRREALRRRWPILNFNRLLKNIPQFSNLNNILDYFRSDTVNSI